MNGRAAAARILLNDRQIWPASGWAVIPPDCDQKTPHRIEKVAVAAGDKIRFVLKHNGTNAADPVVWGGVEICFDAHAASLRADLMAAAIFAWPAICFHQALLEVCAHGFCTVALPGAVTATAFSAALLRAASRAAVAASSTC